MLPFTRDQFLGVFAEYNYDAAVWPAQDAGPPVASSTGPPLPVPELKAVVAGRRRAGVRVLLGGGQSGTARTDRQV